MKILAIGAHPDDVEMRCSGALALFKKKGHDVSVLVLTRGEASGDPVVRKNECKLAASIIVVNRLTTPKDVPTCTIVAGNPAHQIGVVEK